MKEFIIKTYLFFLTALISLSTCIFILLVIIPPKPNSSISLIHGKTKKDSLLLNTPSPRIIFVGGSNLNFGLNSQFIKDSLKLNPINTAIHGGIGLKFMMDNTLKYIKDGDVVILVPEYEQMCGKLIYGSEELIVTLIEVDKFHSLNSLSINQYLNLFNFVFKYSFSKLHPNRFKKHKLLPYYQVNGFNNFGDTYAHWSLGAEDFSTNKKRFRNINVDAFTLINKFNEDLKEKGATMLLSYPSYQSSAFNENSQKIKYIEQTFLETNLDILGTPERYKFTDSLMFDTPYHLIYKGVELRTHLLIEDLKLKGY